MSRERKVLYMAFCVILYAAIMSGLVYFLKHMGLDYVLGFGSGFAFAFGLLTFISKDVRGL
jgi:hypothetical protein